MLQASLSQGGYSVAEAAPHRSNARVTSIRKVRSALASGARINATGRAIRQQLWIFPVLGLIGLLFAGLWVRTHIEKSLRTEQRAQLVTLLKADVATLLVWLRSQEDDVVTAAEMPDIRIPAFEQLELANQESVSVPSLSNSLSRARLQSALEPWIDGRNVTGYVLVSALGASRGGR